ncbi:hypothetical protein QTP88_007584 [Uroleucon formosanum]
MLCEVYSEECLSRARVFEWHKRFCSGREDVEDDDRSGRPTTSSTNENVEKIDKIIRQDRRLSVRAVAKMGIIFIEWVPCGQTVNQYYYKEVLIKLRERVRKKRPDLWKNGWILHQDNAPAHSAFSIQRFLTEKKMSVLQHPPTRQTLLLVTSSYSQKLKVF